MGDAYATCQFDTHAVTVFDVGGQRFADFADLSGQDQLIVVIHIIEVGSYAEALVAEIVAGFVVI